MSAVEATNAAGEGGNVSAGRGCLDGCWRDANGGVRPCRRVVQRANADTAAEAERKSERSSTTEYCDNFLGSSHRTLPFSFMLSISKPYTYATVATRHTVPVLAGCGVFHFFGDGAAFDLDGRADVVASALSVGQRGPWIARCAPSTSRTGRRHPFSARLGAHPGTSTHTEVIESSGRHASRGGISITAP